MHLISIKGSMSFACLKSCLNHAMLNYEKIIQMNSKRQTKFQFKKKEKLKKQYNGEILVIHALLVAYIPLYFWTTENKGFFTLRSPAVWIWWFIAINDSSVAVRKLSNIFFSPSSSAFMKNFSPKTVRPMIPGYCFWWLGRGGGLLILYSENAVIFFPTILELKKYISKVPRSNIPVWGVHQSKIVSPSVKRCALRLHWCIFHMKYFFFCFGPWYRVKLVYYSTRQLHPGAD